MPLYAFACDACGHRFDRLQKVAEPDPSDCPACAQPQVRRQLTAPAFRLAGSGWYETDFKKDGDARRNLAGGSEPPAKAETKAAETAAAAKAEPGAAGSKVGSKPAAAG